MKLHKQLKRLRQNNKLTKKELCERLNIKYSTYNNWEINICNPQVPELCMLADFYGVSVDYLIGHVANTASRAREKEKKKCGYYSVDIRGTKLLSCLSNSVSTYHYSKPQTVLKDEDINMLKRMMDIRITQIDAN